MTLALRYAARSDRGLVRSGNQDSVYAGRRLLAVADGMGGAAGGDVASAIVVATFAPLDEQPLAGAIPGGALVDELCAALEAANDRIRDAIAGDAELAGMGTTLTAMLFGHDKLGLVHVGDSRAYLLRAGELTQVTKDDTYVQMLVDDGKIGVADTHRHPWRSVLVKVVQGRQVTPACSDSDVLAGDRYLICSDGLSGVVAEEMIAATLRDHAEPRHCADRLVQLALDSGGPDNITVIVADASFDEQHDAAAVDEPVVGGAAAMAGS